MSLFFFCRLLSGDAALFDKAIEDLDRHGLMHNAESGRLAALASQAMLAYDSGNAPAGVKVRHSFFSFLFFMF